MPINNSAAWVKEMRKRKGWSMERLNMEIGDSHNLSLIRIERGEQQPRNATMQSLGHVLSVPMNDFICPILENQPANTYIIRFRLSQALQAQNLEQARDLYGKLMDLPGFDTPINRQFLLSQKAQLNYLEGQPATSVLSTINQAITQTMKHYDSKNLNNSLLVNEEPALFHLMAKVYQREGDTGIATQILKGMREGFYKLPVNDKERDATLAPVLLTLAACLIHEKMYKKAIETCNEGLHISAAGNFGQHTPDFLYKKAICLRCLGRRKQARTFYRLAFFGYELLDQKNKAKSILDEARNVDLNFDTYGVETINHKPRVGKPYHFNKMEPCHNISELIKNIRKQDKLKQKDLYQGICSNANYSKMESNRIEGNYYILEPVFQRLGLDIHLYCRFYLGTKNFEAYQTRERIHQLFRQRKYTQAGKMLNELETHKDYQQGNNQQFIKMTKTLVYRTLHGVTPVYLQMLLDALKTTWFDYNEQDIHTRRLTHYEALLINQIAGYYYTIDQYCDAEKIYAALYNGFNAQYKDETEKARLYTTIVYNYACCLNEMEKYNQSMGLLEEVITFYKDRGRLLEIPRLICVWANNLFDTGEKNNSLPYYALAYYGACIFDEYGLSPYIPIIADHVKESFGIGFEL